MRTVSPTNIVNNIKKMKIIFLDIDGVLNCEKTCRTSGCVFPIDPHKVVLLDRIIQATECKVVLSSSWRHHAEGRKNARKAVDFFDTTDRTLNGFRGDEISSWLEHYPEVEKYAILDDDSDFKNWQPLFQTTFKEGLTEKIAQKVIDHFNKK